MSESNPITRLNEALEGRYKIERELGEGGMATVYSADDLRHERKVALKVLKPELAAVVGAERFLAEIKTTANLQHPHILPLFDSGEADKFLFYVMPSVEGESLRERLDRERQLPVDEAVRIATSVAGALDYAHRHDVIHRDIKPANILIHDGEPVISDFGIALAVSAGGGNRLTETGLSLGTPHYMSPEQATGDLSVGAMTDIYSLGCVLYEMLVGEPPFTGSTPQSVLGKIVTGDAPSVIEERRSVPPNVDAAIRKCLEKVPADRFPAPASFASALGDAHFRHGEAVGATAKRADPTNGQWTPVARATTVASLILAAGLAWSLSRDGPSLLVSRLELTNPFDVTAVLGTNQVGLDIASDGSYVVFEGRSPGSEPRLWLRSVAQLTPVPIAGTEGATNPRFSPTGETVAFTVGETLRTVALPGGDLLTLVPDSVEGLQGGLAWGPDGWLYFRKVQSGIWRVSLEGGEAEEVTALSESESAHMWPEVLPSGKGLLFTRHPVASVALTDTEIVLMSLESGRLQVLFNGVMARYARSGHIVYASADGTLRSAPLDQDDLEVGPSRILPDIIDVGLSSAAVFALSGTGTLLYRTPAGVPQRTLWWVGPDGPEEILHPTVVGELRSPRISADGRRVAVEVIQGDGVRQVWLWERDAGAFSPFTSEDDGTDSRRPFWSPDGTELGFIADRGNESLIYSRSISTGETRVLRAESEVIWDAVWTPNEETLVFRTGATNVGTRMALHLAPADPDSPATTLVDDGFQVFSPSVSPDGRWLAYVSNRTGQREIHVQPLPEGRSIQVSQYGGQEPVWASDTELYYRTYTPEVWMVATVSSASGFQVPSRVPFASAVGFASPTTSQHFDISPEDGRLLDLRDGEALDVRHVVVQNFFEVLGERLPN